MKSNQNYLKPQDIVVLLKILAKGNDQWYHHTLAEELGISQSEVSESLNRSKYARLINSERKQVSKLAFKDFLFHGVPFVWAAQPGPVVRGYPTAHSTSPLDEQIMSSEDQFVWPHARGNMKGHGINPLYKSVPDAALNDPQFYELMALTDALRVGKAREVKLAREILEERIEHAQEP